MNYAALTKNELQKIVSEQTVLFNEYKKQNLQLDLSRGKPCREQIELSMPMFEKNLSFKTGADYRNYGFLDGIPEIKKLASDMFGVDEDEIIAGDSSSLNMMYDAIQRSYQFGVPGGEPWKNGKVKFLCPVPGYDRHFAVTELFGIEMIPVPMRSDGPDMDMVEELVKDESVKGIWCVPKFSNPDGIVYSDEVVRRFANLSPAASNFRIFWDNAYFVHFIYKDVPLLNLLQEAKKTGKEDMVYMFSSTSKITFPGSGVAFMIASRKNVEFAKKLISIQTIGPNKLNQYMHTALFSNSEDVRRHMEKHAAILRPKFDATIAELTELEKEGLVRFNKPDGGYFVSAFVLEGCAKEVVKTCEECGLKLTPAGSTYPYKKDPEDCNLRIAPTYATLEDLKPALKVFACAVRLVSAKKFLNA